MYKRQGKHKSALLPLLHIAQADSDGWLSVPVMNRVAEILNIKPIEVYEVASFYSCLLYTSDAADERSSVDLGGRRIIQKQKEWWYPAME